MFSHYPLFTTVWQIVYFKTSRSPPLSFTP